MAKPYSSMIKNPTRPCPDLFSKFLNKLIQKCLNGSATNNEYGKDVFKVQVLRTSLQYGVILEILQVPIFEREGVMKGGFEICEMIDPDCDDT